MDPHRAPHSSTPSYRTEHLLATARDHRTRPKGDDVTNGFPPGFIWGAATASYQVEGAVATDGRGPSIWDTFAHTPGQDPRRHHRRRRRRPLPPVRRRHRPAGGPRPEGVPVLDRLAADPARPAAARRTSRARLLPAARRDLLEHGITPWATLYHWDLPQPFEDAGGWLVRDTADRFARLRRCHARRARRRHRALDHAERAVVLGLPRVRRRRARAGTDRGCRGAEGRAPPAARARAGARGAAGAAASSYRDHPEPGAVHAGLGLGRDLDAARRVDGTAEPAVPRSAPRRPLSRPTCSRTPG